MVGKRTPENIAAGKRLEFLRANLDIPQEVKGTMRAFAAYLDVDESRYRKWTTGDNGIPDTIEAFFKRRHNIPSDWLKHGDTTNIPAWLYKALEKAA